MSVARAYLWKEWRDQRSALLGLAAVLPFLAGGALAMDPGGWVDPWTGAAAGAFAALLVVGTDLVPGERRRARMGFLERLPAGLGAAFTAKLVMFLASVLGAAAYGAALVALALVVRGEPVIAPDVHTARFLLPGLACALWAFAVSGWVPRSTLAFPTALVCIALLCWPGWLFYGRFPAFDPLPWEPWAFLGVCTAGACASAWASFVLGCRFSGGTGRAARRGLLIALPLLAPAWAWAGLRLYSATSIDPAAEDFYIQDCYVGLRADRAFVNARRMRAGRPGRSGTAGPSHPLVVELESGAWREAGEVEAYFARPATHPADGRSERPALFERVWLRAPGGDVEYDGLTGEPVTVARPAQPGIAPPGAAELGLARGLFVLGWAGLGYRVAAAEDGRLRTSGVFDPFRERYVALEELAALPELAGFRDLWVRDGAWLVRLGDGSWSALDPDRLALEPLGLPAHARLGPLTAGGRALLVHGGEPYLFDADTGAREVLRFSDGFAGNVRRVSPAYRNGAPLESYWPPVLDVSGDWNGIARLDEHASLLVRATGREGDVRLLACPDSDSALVLCARREIVRLRFGSAEHEVLFPR